MLFQTVSMSHIDDRKEVLDLGFSNAVYVRPATLKEQVAKKIARLPEVSFLAMTSGTYDLEVNVMCRDNDHLVEFVNEISKLEGVYQTNTTIYFKVFKYAQPDIGLLRK